MGEQDAKRLVNVPRNRRFLVCERIAERFVNAVNDGILSLFKDRHVTSGDDIFEFDAVRIDQDTNTGFVVVLRCPFKVVTKSLAGDYR